MSTTRLTTAAAIVRYLIAQRTVVDDVEVAAVPRRVRHLRPRQRDLPRPGAAGGRRRAADVARPERAGDGTRRCRLRQGCRPAPDHGGHHRRSGPARSTWSPLPASPMANRLPVLLLAGDTFASRLPDPVLQQVEHFGDPTIDGQRRVQVRSSGTGTASRARSRSSSRCRSGRPSCSTRPTAVRRSSRCPRTCRPRRSTSPTGSSSPPSTTIPGRRADLGQLLAAVDALRQAAAAVDHRRRRSALLAGRGRAGGVRRGGTASPSSRRSPASRRSPGTIRATPARSASSGARRQRAGRRCRCGPRRRHPAAGLHDRLVERLPQPRHAH